MKDQLDKLSKDLASGVSRRDALRWFFGGIGAAALTLFTGRKARADGNEICVELCREQELRGKDFGLCVAQSAQCPPGECAFCLNATTTNFNCTCIPVGEFG